MCRILGSKLEKCNELEVCMRIGLEKVIQRLECPHKNQFMLSDFGNIPQFDFRFFFKHPNNCRTP